MKRKPQFVFKHIFNERRKLIILRLENYKLRYSSKKQERPKLRNPLESLPGSVQINTGLDGCRVINKKMAFKVRRNKKNRVAELRSK